jgi:3-dehydroquinate dehydratase / shikimate dehydrogenase
MTRVCAPVKIFKSDDRADLFEVNLGSYKVLYDRLGKKRYLDRDWLSLGERDIASYHNYEETPALDEVFARMKERHPNVEFYKIATFAHSVLDSLRMAKMQKTGVIGVCMGPLGAITRICAPIFGSPIMYVLLREEDRTADGQFLVDDLNDIYNFNKLSQRSSIFALIGDPVFQSVGHVFHNKFFRNQKIDSIYVKLPLKIHELGDFFKLACELNFKGLSVTAPLKEAVVPFLDYVDDIAKSIGVVNTIVIKKGRLFGYNTDAEAAYAVVEKLIGSVERKKIVILGSGGVAKAMAYVLSQKKGDICIVNRTDSRARALALLYKCRYESTVPQDYDLLINATSASMPVSAQYIRPKSFVMDVAVSDTPFLQDAREKKCICENGYALYCQQACKQQDIWYKNGLFN